MIDVVQGHDESIKQWVQNETGLLIDGDSRALGVIKDGVLIAGIVYHNYKGFMVECTLATTDRAWCQKGTVKAFMSYPFEVLGCVRFWATCRRSNKKMRTMFNKLGFKYEGCARRAFDGEEDAMIYSILKDENKWMDLDEQGT